MVLIWLVKVTPLNMRNPSLLATQCCSAFWTRPLVCVKVLSRNILPSLMIRASFRKGRYQTNSQSKQKTKWHLAASCKSDYRNVYRHLNLKRHISTPGYKSHEMV